MSHYQYRRWDGSQIGFDLDADSLLAEVTDDLLYHGDLNAALRRMMQTGMTDRDGRRVAGLKELMDRLRQARSEQLDRYDLGGVYSDIADELRQVLDEERSGLDELSRQALESGDQRRAEVTDQVVAERRLALNLLPPDLAGQVRGLQEYDFTSTEARERFDALLDKLREALMASQFEQMAGAMRNMDPEQTQRVKDMFDALNRMIEQRQAGAALDPTFEDFMSRFGDMFSSNP
ncbi:MAG: hypothetical protein ACRD0E_12360, partial [Acidimicrobiales bacterium]